MNNAIILISFAAAWTSGCLLIAEWLGGQRRQVRKRFAHLTNAPAGGSSEASSLFRNLENAGAGEGWLARGRTLLDQSALPLSLAQVGCAMACLSAAGAAAGVAAGAHWLVIVAAAMTGATAPLIVVWTARNRRIEQITRQLPEAFDIMRRAVHAGQTVPSAMQLASQELRGPLSREFNQCCEQQNLGLPYDVSLRDLSRRIPIAELHIFAIAMMVQRQFGGNPAEILGNMSDLIRKRTRLRNRVRALTGEGRMQALVLTILPVAAFLWLSTTRPEYIQTLLQRPQLLAGVALLELVGTIWIRRIVRIEY